MARIHPTAQVDARAQLGEDVEVAAYALIGAQVRIDEGTRIGPYCVIEGHTTIGRDNRIFQSCAIGGPPQDKKYAGEPTRLEIGRGNTIREFCTINLGTVQDVGVTRIGDDNWIMAYVHIAHDCQVGNHTIMANLTQLAGHVQLGDWVVVGGMSGLHQFIRVGAHAMIGFQTRLSQDLPPFVTAAGNPAEAQGINAEGLKRRGFGPERIEVIKQMHRLLYRRSLTLADAKQQIGELPEASTTSAADVELMLDFLATAQRGIVR
ncbi:MAG TPA: acyl-ACP--UDP-N-acetylglucosamine O-acyltransferase [Rubrivivax sp.]|nr:acyl-ACP--UDP-N-acetylglucosamine O-acyltransferase [Rubrivivax sp.]